MRTFLIIVLFVSTALAGNRQSNIPEAAKEQLKKLYPKAEEIKWSEENGNYEAEFEIRETDMSIVLNARGVVLETETTIEAENLPDAVKKGIIDDFPEYTITETARIDKQGKLTYEVEVHKDGEILDAIYSPDGKLVRKILKKNEEENDSKNEEKEN